eukprot:CAMPEP_0172897352 /NCGR_PEP_ID=MMETSP1075-20121228/157366_1 /TAXON_ID=2916 /ORGANISM="Ceratium fusus, Strain PA161109" /LENGTH=49 /DNA_ID=CAMNT_0013752915 /DNA_START=98 /DNA_END=247 /DNA_ORIENTATION=+
MALAAYHNFVSRITASMLGLHNPLQRQPWTKSPDLWGAKDHKPMRITML